MVILEKFRKKGHEIKSDVFLLYRGLGDPRMPLMVKLLSFLIVAYVLSPIDIIPDFIPVLGLLDEVILLPIMLSFTVRFIPSEIKHEYEHGKNMDIEDQHLSHMGSAMILIVWCVIIGLCLYYLKLIQNG